MLHDRFMERMSGRLGSVNKEPEFLAAHLERIRCTRIVNLLSLVRQIAQT